MQQVFARAFREQRERELCAKFQKDPNNKGKKHFIDYGYYSAQCNNCKELKDE